MRFALAAVLLAGCQLVFPLGTDEDGDGEIDEDDPCPHIANEDPHDTDGDGAADVCDLDPLHADVHKFLTFRGGLPRELAISGPISAVDGGLELGDIEDGQNEDFIALDIGARQARVDIGIEILDRKEPATAGTGFEEIGIFIQHDNFVTNVGPKCIVGRDSDPPSNYLQSDDGAQTRFDGDLAQVRGMFSMTLDGGGQRCSVELGSPNDVVSRAHQFQPLDVSGKIAISTTQLRVRIEYLWVVYTTESR